MPQIILQILQYSTEPNFYIIYISQILPNSTSLETLRPPNTVKQNNKFIHVKNKIIKYFWI